MLMIYCSFCSELLLGILIGIRALFACMYSYYVGISESGIRSGQGRDDLLGGPRYNMGRGGKWILTSASPPVTLLGHGFCKWVRCELTD